MPLFKYLCEACDNQFEIFVQASTVVDCPTCKGTKLEKQLSVFNPGRGQGAIDPAPSVGPCGSCGDPRGPGACFNN